MDRSEDECYKCGEKGHWLRDCPREGKVKFGERLPDPRAELLAAERAQARILCQFVSESGETAGAPFDLPRNIQQSNLEKICNAILQKEEEQSYAFYVDEKEIRETLGAVLDENEEKKEDTESVVQIVYQPQALFKVRAVTRCTSTLDGHAEAVISTQFSPDGRHLASGSGDQTVRFWDVNTETPTHVCKGHKHWVLAIAWSPDGLKLASGCKKSQIYIWDPKTGQQIGHTLNGHRQWITSLCWKPLHLDPDCRHLASASKDTTIIVWDTVLGQRKYTLSGHLQSVTCIRWGGTGLIYSGSQDRTVKVFEPEKGLQRTLKGHAHWVNTMALSTDYVLRTAAYEPANADQDIHAHYQENKTREELSLIAKARYGKVKDCNPERLVTGSDDFTLFLWNPEIDETSIARMTGHQQVINQVQFSPDTRLIASASFDKSIKVWNSSNGKFLFALRGHVQRVYQLAWSADSRLIVSGSQDSTLKLFDVKKKKMIYDLPGHADDVYAVDWSPDGQRVVSGGKDKVLKLWRR